MKIGGTDAEGSPEHQVLHFAHQPIRRRAGNAQLVGDVVGRQAGGHAGALRAHAICYRIQKPRPRRDAKLASSRIRPSSCKRRIGARTQPIRVLDTRRPPDATDGSRPNAMFVDRVKHLAELAARDDRAVRQMASHGLGGVPVLAIDRRNVAVRHLGDMQNVEGITGLRDAPDIVLVHQLDCGTQAHRRLRAYVLWLPPLRLPPRYIRRA